ncbi:MAG: histidine kinase dimerization/phosphoacceptor domain -containing protein [Ferruginibacter sp.]
MKQLLILLLILSFCSVTTGQDISRQEADSFLDALKMSRPDTARISLLLKLAEFQIFKRGEYKQDLDSAAGYIDQARVLHVKIKSAGHLGFITLVEAFLTKERGQRDAAKKMVEQAIEISGREKDQFHLARAYFELADYYDYNIPEQLTEKIKLVEKALAGFQQTGSKERVGYTLKVLADLYDGDGASSKALQALDLSLEAYQSINYTQLQGVYVLYGGVYYERGDYSQALSYFLLALKSAEKSADTTMNLCQIHNSMGVILFQLGEKEKAIAHYKIALQIAEKYNDNFNILLMLTNIVDGYNRIGKPGEALKVLNNIPGKFLTPKDDASYYVIPKAYLSIYYHLKNYPRAYVYANELLSVVKKHDPGKRSMDNIYQLLINYYISSGQLKAAGLYLKKKDLISRQVGDPNTINQNNFLKFRLDTALGNFRLAVQDILKFNKIKDSLFNETKSKQIKRLEIDYETGKKEDSIKIKDKNIIVLNQQNQLQKGYLDRANLLRNVTLGGILLLVVIMCLFYRQYRNKQRSSQVIMLKNELLEHLLKEKEWLLKEVHHRVKNNLQTVVSLLELQSENLDDEALSAIHDSQNRIYAMSLIHQKLYQSDNIASINMETYLKDLTGHLREIYNVGAAINIHCNAGAIEMDVSQAIPIGLIINEAVTNSIKYAFTKAIKNPEIIISLDNKSNNRMELVIADNGAGLPPGFMNESKKGLGFRLMKGLAEDIEGEFTVESVNGMQIIVYFNASIPFQGTNTMVISDKMVAA